MIDNNASVVTRLNLKQVQLIRRALQELATSVIEQVPELLGGNCDPIAMAEVTANNCTRALWQILKATDEDVIEPPKSDFGKFVEGSKLPCEK